MKISLKGKQNRKSFEYQSYIQSIMQYEFLIEKAGFKQVAYLNGLNGTIGSGIKVGLAVTKI